MTEALPSTGRQLFSLVTAAGELVLSLADVPVPEPGPDEVVVRVEASPVNPSDLRGLVGAADLGTARASGTPERPSLTARIPAQAMRAMAARIDQPMPVGNEGAGVVVKAGSSPAAQALLGRLVAGLGGAMYAQYQTLHAARCLPLPPGTSARDGASCFVNPLTALSFVETLRAEGHTALVHTAAASNLGQMLVRICRQDGIPLVNVVRRPDQAELLRSLGAEHVVVSDAPDFHDRLTDILAATGATLGFDAVGGGPLAGQLLAAMEAAASRKLSGYSRYGSGQRTQVYVYGRLDTAPTVVPADVGFSWNLGGYLLTPFLEKAGPEVQARMQRRVVAELTTTFASRYGAEIPLAGLLDPATLAACAARATGAKFLVTPAR